MREFIRHLVDCKIDFILIVSDVLVWSIMKSKVDFGVGGGKTCIIFNDQMVIYRQYIVDGYQVFKILGAKTRE